ncbi:MAG: acetyl/propionyl/methylcrotonyl-CoA carboxylase subunit alpha [Sphingomonadales bacterium]
MFKKILIANRGEIACRVIKSARAMGIKTVAVYSDADATALHVEMADEAVHLGPPPAGQSYLLIDKIIAACQQTGAEAVHPGYGFLSERTAFAEALEQAGIAFIGPPKGAIAAMGDKIESKKLAAKAGVSTVPGHIGEIEDPEEAVKIAQNIGFPVMIKASAGGGGKGMRIAHNDREVREGFEGARNEARSSFGDDRVFIEKFVVEPRHIEIQILGDKHGNILYLGERECSIQRRHQKVVEEAPSPFVDDAMRKAMGEQAVALARAVDYHSAGTVEFIVGADKSFYFLEMNTRLQVEHPVTEQVTGIDLVEQMIRVAAGEKLPFTQDDIKLTGWAVENRVYAEDPYRNFLPSIGRLVRYRQPEGERVRVDTGVVEGSEISMFYDPMIAKLVTWGDTRLEAIDRQLEALDRYYIRGISHNIHFLSAVMAHPRFREGRLTTGFIAEEYPDGFAGAPTSDAARQRLIAVAAIVNILERSRESEISGQLNGAPSARTEWIVELDQQRVPVRLDADGEQLLVKFDDRALAVESDWLPGMPVFDGTVDGHPIVVEIDRANLGMRLSTQGATHKAVVYDPQAAVLAAHMIEKVPPDTSKMLLCPMPGQVVRIEVAVGDQVEPGQPLAIVEAMKMENILRAERQAVVKAINAQAGSNLPVDAVIMEFE